MTHTKRMVWFTLIGALVGAIIATWLGPKYLVWYFDPPVNNILNCSPAIAWALRRLQWIQVFGVGIGVALGMVVAVIFLRRKRGENVM